MRLSGRKSSALSRRRTRLGVPKPAGSGEGAGSGGGEPQATPRPPVGISLTSFSQVAAEPRRLDEKSAAAPRQVESGSVRPARRMKSHLVQMGRPIVNLIWPGIALAATLKTQMSRPDTIGVSAHDEWSDELDQVLAALPKPAGCTREAYRQLCLPTSYRKRHFVVNDQGEPTALLSVRRRRNFWEPVSYQALPGFIGPARDQQSLGAALRNAGIEISISAGLDSSAGELGANVVYAYDVNVVDLTSDYEAHWHQAKRKQMNSVQKARRKCKNFDIVIDGEGDLEWGLLAWRDMWADDEQGEVCAYPDRLRFWNHIRKQASEHADDFKLHTLCVRDGARVAACVIFLSRGKDLFWQCTSRDKDYNRFGVGTYALDSALQWARDSGFRTVDLAGGGGFKAEWAPRAGQRHGALFRPGPIPFFRKFDA